MTNFDQSKHPRNSAGTSQGGQFALKQHSVPEAGLDAPPESDVQIVRELILKSPTITDYRSLLKGVQIAQRMWDIDPIAAAQLVQEVSDARGYSPLDLQLATTAPAEAVEDAPAWLASPSARQAAISEFAARFDDPAEAYQNLKLLVEDHLRVDHDDVVFQSPRHVYTHFRAHYTLTNQPNRLQLRWANDSDLNEYERSAIWALTHTERPGGGSSRRLLLTDWEQERLIAHAVKRGRPEAQARAALDRILTEQSTLTLASVLTYEGFATARTAGQVADRALEI